MALLRGYATFVGDSASFATFVSIHDPAWAACRTDNNSPVNDTAGCGDICCAGTEVAGDAPESSRERTGPRTHMTTPAATHEVQMLIDDTPCEVRVARRRRGRDLHPRSSRKADPDKFGVSLVTAEGRVFETGDCDHRFTIQSVSKPFTFGIALEELGHEKVSTYVGVEPSGDTFNSIELQPGTNRPFNPMVNSGAIAVTALLHGRYGESTIDCIVDRLSTLAGRRLTIDEDVYASERRTGHRNRAIAHLLMNFGMLHSEAEAALDVYFGGARSR